MVRTVAVAISDQLSVSAHLNYYLRIASGVARNFIEAVNMTLKALCVSTAEKLREAWILFYFIVFFLFFLLFKLISTRFFYFLFCLSLSAHTHTHREGVCCNQWRRNHGANSGWRPHEIFTVGCALIRLRFK